ncbi:hypothetical protein Dsin_029366 [Dipteronia sinensis]|uniref:Uncharacterized protein n=1 Tax=Dipteronia sinensis TaxID=43782 RepID=A0AAE0DVB3_9ROSI|nr:hypothetical protein Dsin_029366 [Dipteronia sinensis]
MSWNGEGSFLFTSSSAPFDCNDNGPCDEDATSLSVAILKKKLRGRILLGCDNHPVSRQEVMDLVSKSGKFSKKFEGFTASEDEGGLDLQKVLIIFIIALVMMAVCYQPPRRPTVYAVYRCC